jgi:hypothetical protein
MLVARGHNGALTRLEEDGHGVAVGEATADGDGDSSGLAMDDEVGVGEGDVVDKGLSLQAAHSTKRQTRPKGFRCSFACARW